MPRAVREKRRSLSFGRKTKPAAASPRLSAASNAEDGPPSADGTPQPPSPAEGTETDSEAASSVSPSPLPTPSPLPAPSSNQRHFPSHSPSHSPGVGVGVGGAVGVRVRTPSEMEAGVEVGVEPNEPAAPKMRIRSLSFRRRGPKGELTRESAASRESARQSTTERAHGSKGLSSSPSLSPSPSPSGSAGPEERRVSRIARWGARSAASLARARGSTSRSISRGSSSSAGSNSSAESSSGRGSAVQSRLSQGVQQSRLSRLSPLPSLKGARNCAGVGIHVGICARTCRCTCVHAMCMRHDCVHAVHATMHLHAPGPAHHPRQARLS